MTASLAYDQTSIAVLARRAVQQPAEQAATVKQFEPQRLLTDPEMLPFHIPSGRGCVVVPQPVPAWLRPMLSTLVQFAWLPMNWDTYGGVPSTSKAFFAGLELISRLMTDVSASPAAVPTSEGGIQFEWYRAPGDELEIRIGASGELSLFRVNERDGQMVEHDSVDVAEISALVSSLVGKL